MNHAQKDKEISQFNSFEVFDDIYKGEKKDAHFDQLDMPAISTHHFNWRKVSIALVIIILVSLAVHPLLSYILKTPYPLMVISEDSIDSMVKRHDLVLITGVIHQAEIKTNDLIVYTSDIASISTHLESLAIKRVVDRGDDWLMVADESETAAALTISPRQIIGKLVGKNSPLRLPFAGTISNLIAGK